MMDDIANAAVAPQIAVAEEIKYINFLSKPEINKDNAINHDELKINAEKLKNVRMNFYDAGGQQEYLLFNDTLITDGSIVGICFDSTNFQYTTSIAPFMDLIFTTNKLVAIALIATHCYENLQKHFDEKMVLTSALCHYEDRCNTVCTKKLNKKPKKKLKKRYHQLN